jgi:hypothetical protein
MTPPCAEAQWPLDGRKIMSENTPHHRDTDDAHADDAPPTDAASDEVKADAARAGDEVSDGEVSDDEDDPFPQGPSITHP